MVKLRKGEDWSGAFTKQKFEETSRSQKFEEISPRIQFVSFGECAAFTGN